MKSDPLTMPLFGFTINDDYSEVRIIVSSNRQAYGHIFEGLDKQLKDSELCEVLDGSKEFCELASSVAVIHKLQRELDDRDATDADLAVLNEIRRSSNPWLRREARNLLALIADEREQVAVNDGEAE